LTQTENFNSHEQDKNSVKAQSGRFFGAFWFLAVIILLFSAPACGKKGQPTLRGFEKPVPPAAFQAIHREDSIILSWHYPAGRDINLADFIVLRSSDSIFRELVHLERSRRNYEDTDFETDRTYMYKVVARNVRGIYSEDSNIISITPLAPPLPPSDLSYTVEGNSVFLSWKPVKEGVLYNLYRRVEKGEYGFAPLNSKPLSENSFTDILDVNKPVFYVVRSLHAAEGRSEGVPSAELSVLPSELVPAPPENVRYYPASGRLFLSWDDPKEPWVTGFRVYRRIEGKEYELLGETQIPTFIDPNPVSAKSDYRINAVGPSKEGPGTEIRGISHIR
jgi:hypothetical protein